MYDYPSDFMLNLFDRHGIEISQGSACSSGTSRPSLFLERMSLGKYAKNGLRLSHSCHLKLAEAENILSAMKIVLDKI